MKAPAPKLREGTSDGWIWRSVFHNNEYGLLDCAGRTVVDVGANIGAFACLAAERGAEKIVAVEPFGPNFEVLLSNVAPYSQITAVRRAIGATSGEPITMRTTEEFMEQAAGEFPGKPVNFGGFHVGDHVGGSDTVDTISLAHLMADQGIERIDVLKLDCESAEWPVFLALEPEVFAKIGELCGEYHLVGNVSALGEDRADALSWLRKKLEANGFTLELASHETNPRLGWFYARNSWVDKPACAFLAKGHAKAKPKASPDAASKAATAAPAVKGGLERELAELKKSHEQLRARVAAQDAAIAELRATQSILRKAAKLGRDPVAFFRDMARKRAR